MPVCVILCFSSSLLVLMVSMSCSYIVNNTLTLSCCTWRELICKSSSPLLILVFSVDALYRSDFFPGLGWMLTKSTWDELSPKWPKAYPFLLFWSMSYLHYNLIDNLLYLLKCFPWQHYTYWDDWLRLKENHKGRQFIRPEVCRTYNFGEHVRTIFVSFVHYCRDIMVYFLLCI